MEISVVQAIKLTLVQTTGLPKDALHIYVGLATLFVAAAIARRSVSAWLPLMAVLVLTVIGELVDLNDDLDYLGYWRWRDSIFDIGNTMFWPLIIFVLARHSTLFQRQIKSSVR